MYGVTGKVGAGKSSLLSAILGELPYNSGSVFTNGRIAFVEQSPILFSGSIKDNILLGKSFVTELYQSALQLSCLKTDMMVLAEGDATQIGENGANLSGGQRARLSLARALYTEADIYLLDDPISAVDAKVAKRIFTNCLLPLSMTSTVILITHQLAFIQECEEVIILENGHIADQGAPSDLKAGLESLKS